MIPHIRTRYIVLLFLALGLGSEILLWQTKASPTFLTILSPALAAGEFINSGLPFLSSLSPLFNELAVVFPITLLYFGLAGYWTGQILKEDGFAKYLILFCFIGFLIVLHWQASEHITALLYRP